MTADRIRRIEDFAKATVRAITASDLRIAHGFGHLDRVRGWALQIAKHGGGADLVLVETAALLHDVGLAHVAQRTQHAEVGADVAARFLRQERLFTEHEIEAIATAIRFHSSVSGGGSLGNILRDADILDALGAIGLMRAFTTKYALPEYDPCNVKGDAWGTTAREYDRRLADGRGIGNHIVDQVNFQISWYDNLTTAIAREIAAPLVRFMEAYVIQLEREAHRCLATDAGCDLGPWEGRWRG
jgi:hypothetical protein